MSSEKVIKKQKNPFQDNAKNILEEFIKYYYDCLNNKNFNELIKFYKKFSEIIFDSVLYKGETLQNLFMLLQENNIKYTIKTIDYLMSGNHRMNILVTGTITVNDNISKLFTEYLHFGTCKDNVHGYWIQSSIFRSI